MRKMIKGLAVVTGIGVAACEVAAAQPVGLGEFQVNSFTTGAQRYPAVAMDAGGDFVVVWQGPGQDGAATGVFARRFDAGASPQATEFRVSSYTSGSQQNPAVAADADGDFVVVWESIEQDGYSTGIFARRFDAAGQPQAAEFQVNSYTSDVQRNPTVAMDSDGDFVVAWQSYLQDGDYYGIFAQRFNAAGVPQASEFKVNSFTDDEQQFPAVAMDNNGGFIVAWQSYGEDGFSEGIFARRFDAAGSFLATEFQVHSFTMDQRFFPAVDIDGEGDFVVTWEHNDGNFDGIFGQRFDSGGSPAGAELQINTYETEIQGRPAVALDDDGDFVVAWLSNLQDGASTGIFGQRFDSAGSPQGVEFQATAYTAGAQRHPAVASDSDGDFVIVWESAAQDGSGDGVFARRFATLAVLDVDGDGVLAALADGILILRHLFDFSGATLVTGAVGAGCTRCTAPDIAAYLDSIASQLDVDGNTSLDALTDGLLALRFLFGFTGSTLTTGAVALDCSRCDATTILPYLQGLT
jgi:hypothetical protein